MSELRIPASQMMHRLTLNVRITGMERLRWRVRIACWFLALAAKIAGCGIHKTETPYQ